MCYLQSFLLGACTQGVVGPDPVGLWVAKPPPVLSTELGRLS